jgi:hypothetical protein
MEASHKELELRSQLDADVYEPIDMESARRPVSQATCFTRVMTDPETGGAVSWGTKKYTPATRMRELLSYRDHRFPAYSRAAVFCDDDHTYDHPFGGPTRLDNLAMLSPNAIASNTTPPGRRNRSAGAACVGPLQTDAVSVDQVVAHNDGLTAGADTDRRDP